MQKNKGLLIVFLLLVGILSNTASAAVYYINGTVNASDTGLGLASVTVTANTTNTTTTNSWGFWSLANNNNGTATLVFTKAGYTSHSNNSVVSSADNTTNNVTMTIITPTSSVAVSSIAKFSATVTGTVTATDSVNNNYVGNRLRYSKDSALTNNLFTTAWSNSTAAPSWSLGGLELKSTYYYSLDTYSLANGSYSILTTGSFTTQKGNYTEDDEIYYTTTPAPTPLIVQTAKKGIFGDSIIGGKSGTLNKIFVVFVVAVLIVAVLFVWSINSQKTSKTPKIRKSKR